MQWKEIPGFSNYIVSEYGVVKHKNGEVVRTINSFNRDNSYLAASIVDDHGKHKLCYVHRLVAISFDVPKPGNYGEDELVVNHIDGNKYNNHISNLEWITRSDNAFHAIIIGMRKDNVEIVVYDVLLREYTIYYSIIEVSRKLNISRSLIPALLYRHRKIPYKGRYLFAYDKESFDQVERKKREVKVYDGVKDRILTYKSLSEASRSIGVVKDSMTNELNVPIEKRRTIFGYDFYSPEETIIRKNVDYVKSREKLYKISGGNIDV